MTTKRQRAARKGRGLRLTERDMEMLAWVAAAQPVRTCTFLTLGFFTSHSALMRRLRKLRDSGFLLVDVPHMNTENRYRLSQKGARCLAELGKGDGPGPRVLRGHGARGEHHDVVVDLHASLSRATARSDRVTLLGVHHERDLRAGTGRAKRSDLVPDALAQLQSGQLVWTVCVEVDMGTERLSELATGKLASYESHSRADSRVLGAPLTVALVASSMRRARLMLEASREQHVENLYVAARENISAESILAAIWATPRGKVGSPFSDGPVQTGRSDGLNMSAPRESSSFGTSGSEPGVPFQGDAPW